MGTDRYASTVRRRLRRRSWLGGIGLGVAGVGAGLIYRQAPTFWQQYARELGQPIDPVEHRPDPAKWPDRGVHAAWLGHSTVLIKVDGFTILTDPVFSDRIGIGLGPLTLGLKRLRRPALEIRHLPAVDLVLLSHAHMDHFDLPSLRALESRRVEVVTAARTADLLRVERYGRVQEIGWGEEARVGPLVIKGLRVRHWGARMRTDTWRGYNGYQIQAGRRRILFAGDTAITDGFRKLGNHDLAVMPIGAYNPWIATHCSPEEAWRMSNDARASAILPIHHKTFHLSREPLHEPIERLQEVAGNSAGRILAQEIGQQFSLG